MTVLSDESCTRIIHSIKKETEVTILHYGATVISWKVNGVEQLFLSSASKLDGSRAVRGGIPLVFPRFGPPREEHSETVKLPQHGFARLAFWEVLGQCDDHTVQFGLGPEYLTKDLSSAWPYNFSLIYTVSLGETHLRVDMEVRNADTKPFEFNLLFHTYCRVDDVTKVAIKGLKGLKYIDKVRDDTKVESDDQLRVETEVDRVYMSAPSTLTLEDNGQARFRFCANNMADTVVWNPWSTKAGAMSDFEPKEAYKNMICVETGYVAQFVKLNAHTAWKGGMTIEALQ